MRTVQVAKLLGSTVLAVAAWASPAFAVTAEITTKDASLVGDSFTFTAATTDVVGVALYRWSFGDDVKTDYTAGQSQVEHVYAKPGHYTVSVTVKDDSSTFGGDTFT